MTATPPTALDRLKAGFRGFRAINYEARPDRMRELAAEQHPEVLVIACSDSRADPAILFNVQPGELFIVRNVANLVPPYEPDEHYHGTSAALEFAVRDLEVRHAVVLGHSGCGGIQALTGGTRDREFIGRWTAIAAAAGNAGESHEAEQAAIGVSLANLLTFPWLRERVDAGKLDIHGWWFDIATGFLWDRNDAGDFDQIA